jgi:two-component system response regulator YesN
VQDLATYKHPCLFPRKLRQVQEALELIRDEIKPETEGLPREIADILRYIYEHLFDPTLSVGSLRVTCRLRNNNISTRFRKILGIGIREYIEALRLEAACHLLRQERCEVYLAAMAVGYFHEETFCRAFHRRFRRSPSELWPPQR